MVLKLYQSLQKETRKRKMDLVKRSDNEAQEAAIRKGDSP